MTRPTSTQIQLRLLGAVDLRGANGSAIDAVLRQPKRLAVLAYLACARPRGFHRRDTLAALFWPELAPDRARAALRTTLTRLRDDLGDACILTRGADEIGIDAARIWCDAAALDALIAANDAVAARALYRGAFLEGVHVEGAADGVESWIAGERTRLPLQLASALHREAERAASLGDAARTLELLREALDVSPLDERIARALIKAQLEAGDRGSALATFDSLSIRMRREFDVAVSAETEAMVAPVRQALAVPSASAAKSPSVRGGRGATGGARRTTPSATAAVEPGSKPADVSSHWRRAPILGALGLVAVAVVWAGPSLIADASPRDTLRWRLAPTDDGRREARHHPLVLLDSTRSSLAIIGGMVRAEPLLLASDMLRARGVTQDRRTEWRTDSVMGPGATGRWITSSALDLDGDRAMVFGGASGTTLPCYDDLWVIRDISGLGGQTRWQAVTARGARPSRRADAHLFFDSARRELVLYGGHDCVSTYYVDAWTFRFDDESLRSGQWMLHPIATGDDAPSPRIHSLVEYDARLGRLFVVFGELPDGPREETWLMEGLRGAREARWRTLRCAQAPPARANAPTLWDDATQSMLVVGGLSARGVASNELWLLSGLDGDASACAWRKLDVEGDAPIERYGSIAHFDPRDRRVVLHGGYHRGAPLIDVWTLPDPFRR